ncbi:hypothetical protein V6N13_053091 [Hibiscus sabdariffa]|uniref:Uncharacterized protein n=1 Tax=Hibiscus sabdariffa TaxID=183260 RepID=A0ABR2Q683_9ROSI
MASFTAPAKSMLRAPSSKKSIASPVTQQRLPAAGAPEDNVKAPKRRVKNLAIEERKLGVSAANSDNIEQKMSKQSTNKVNPSISYGEMCKPRTSQKNLEAGLNGFCPTLINTSHENRVVQVKPIIKSSSSLSHDMLQAFHLFSSMSNEMTRVTYEGSNLPPPKLLVNPWIEETLNKILYDMNISVFNKRKRDLLEPLESFLSNKRALKEDILEVVIETEPGIWNASGVGLIENEDVVNFFFSSGSDEGPSKIISRIEKQFKGRASGCRRLSGIKHAARAKRNDLVVSCHQMVREGASGDSDRFPPLLFKQVLCNDCVPVMLVVLDADT